MAPLDDATQVYVPTRLCHRFLLGEHCTAHAGYPGANKVYQMMRRWYYRDFAVIDVYAFAADCAVCAKGKIGARRRTNYLRTNPLTDPLTDQHRPTWTPSRDAERELIPVGHRRPVFQGEPCGAATDGGRGDGRSSLHGSQGGGLWATHCVALRQWTAVPLVVFPGSLLPCGD